MYVAKYDIYGEKKVDTQTYGSTQTKKFTTVGNLVDEIYQKQYGILIDYEFVQLYIKCVGLQGYVTPDTKIDNKPDLYALLTEWIPDPATVWAAKDKDATQLSPEGLMEEFGTSDIEEIVGRRK